MNICLKACCSCCVYTSNHRNGWQHWNPVIYNIVRGMATGRIEVGSELLVLVKELKVGLILGILYGVLLGIFANLKFIGTDPMLGLVVGLSIASSMLIAVTVGSFTPLILRKLEIDPAVAAGPFVTTSIDILGVLLYFVIAGILLKI